MYTPTMEVPVPTLADVGLEEYNALLLDRQATKKIIEDLDAKVKAIDEQLGLIFDAKEVKTVVWNNYVVIRRKGNSPRPVLDRVLLLEAGVTPQQLNAGTKLSEPGKPGITVRPITENKTKGLNYSSGE